MEFLIKVGHLAFLPEGRGKLKLPAYNDPVMTPYYREFDREVHLIIDQVFNPVASIVYGRLKERR